MRAQASWLFLLVASNAACLRHTEFKCSTDGECSGGGTCEAVGYCSFPDSACSSGQKFGDSAGPFAGQCVGGQNTDGGLEPLGDVPGEMMAAGCPSGYVNAGAQPHMYKLITTATDWQTQQDSCAATKPGGAAYLAIPDDITELMDIDTVAAANLQYWVGITDVVTDGVYKTVKGDTQSFLPWATGQPAPEPPPHDCVKGLSLTAQFATEKCNTSIVAICECEP